MLRPALPRGASLVELLVGSALGLVILGGLLRLYVDTVTGSSDGLRMAHLQQQLRAAMQVMRQDLRRAGYYGVPSGPAFLEQLRHNPFTDADDPGKPAAQRNDIRVGQFEGAQEEAADSCVLYSYDLDGDGALTPSGAGMERFGFRLREGRLQMRYGGEPFGCSQGVWHALTDVHVEITRLQFTLESTGLHPDGAGTACVAGEPCLFVRAVGIQLEGRMQADPSLRMQLHQRVRLRNDRYLAAYQE